MAARGSLIIGLDERLADLEALYQDLHEHPELSFQELRTAALMAERLAAAGFEVTSGVGKTGVVGVLRNGDGPGVLLRAVRQQAERVGATGAGRHDRPLRLGAPFHPA